MFEAYRHPSDEEILQSIDHELSPNRLEQLTEHLAACPECRERQASIENRLIVLNEFYHAETVDSIAMKAASRHRLQEQLAQCRRKRSTSYRLIPALHLRLSITAATLLVATGFTIYGWKHVKEFKDDGRVNSAEEYIVPNRSFTPGAVRAVSLNKICSASDDNLDPEVSPTVAVAVLKEYGMSPDASAVQKYQIDYLVNPQLGGTSDMKNLWPQSYTSGRWNAQAKDELERHLHQMVCNGTINLTVAQQAIADDWIAAYKKYVGREGS